MSNFQFIAKIIAKNSLKTRLHFFFFPRKTLKNAVAAQKSKAQLKNVNKNFREAAAEKSALERTLNGDLRAQTPFDGFFRGFLGLG